MDRQAQQILDELLERARRIAREVLAPRANATDQAPVLPAENLRCLASGGLLGLAAPLAYGGHGAPPAAIREYMATLAAACGVTTFVQMQHVLALGLIGASGNKALKKSALPALAAGERFCSVAYSHVRRPGPPMMRVEQIGKTYRFEGTAPWLTGWGLAQDCVFGGTLPDGRYLFALAPLEDTAAINASPPMRLCAMNASATVSVTCSELRVPREAAICVLTPDELAARDAGAAYRLSSLSLGVSRGATTLLQSLAEQRGSGAHREVARDLEREARELAEEIDAGDRRAGEPDYAERGVELRASAIELGVRAAHSAVAAAGGSANSLDHSAQRFLREAMLYTLVGQTRDLQTATLERLATRGSS